MSDGLRIGDKILRYDTVDSTNNVALRTAQVGMVIVADTQTAGRGRRGRQWHSPPGLGLYFSVALDGCRDGVTVAAALGVRDAVRHACQVQVKWPNDLLHDGKKLCGILVEHRGSRSALGIGVNVHHQPGDFPPELRDRCTSLDVVTGRRWARMDLLQDILERLDVRLSALENGGYEALHEEWRCACNLLGRRVRIDGRASRVVAIEGSGALLVEDEAGRRRICSGEIELALSADERSGE